MSEAGNVYAVVMGALHGRGWSTIDQVADRTGLPRPMVKNALTELVGAGNAFVQVEARVGGAVLVYTDEPS